MFSRASLSRSVCGIAVVLVLAVTAACSRESREDAAKAVEKLPAQAERQLERAAGVLDDATITAKVKSALIAEPQLKGLAIDVDTSKNVVTLSGSVASDQARADAERIAKQVEGVAGVKNNLEVKKPS